MGLLDEKQAFNLPDMGAEQSGVMDVLKRLQIAGGYSSGSEGSTKASGYGGRIGYDIPLDNSMLNLGVSGGGFHAKGDGFNIGKNQITGADLTYSMPNQSVSLRYDQNGMLAPSMVQTPTMEAEMANGISPMQKNLLQLIYKKQF